MYAKIYKEISNIWVICPAMAELNQFKLDRCQCVFRTFLNSRLSGPGFGLSTSRAWVYIYIYIYINKIGLNENHEQ